MDDVIGRTAGDVSVPHFAVQGLDDIAALAHAPQRILQPLFQSPPTGAKFFGEAKACQFLQSTHPQCLLESVAVDSGNDTVLVHFAHEAAVDAGQALLLNFMAQPVLDLAVCARPKIETDQFRSALAHAGGDIVASDD